MHPQYAATTCAVAPTRLLSLTHFLIQAASSASARAGVTTEAKLKAMRMAANVEIVFMATLLARRGLVCDRTRERRGRSSNTYGCVLIDNARIAGGSIGGFRYSY